MGEQTILFTDIVGSTQFYSTVGDAKAFADVRTHFQEVFAEIDSRRGVVVKTIGDAVMASFQSPLDALAASISIQEKFHQTRSDIPIKLRVSLHTGPVIAVHLHSGIDYFGNTVNYAAKIQGTAGACEIALSEDMYKIYLGTENSNFQFDIRKNQRDGGVPGNIYVLKIKAHSLAVRGA